jgi:hypothetical protein
MMMVFICLLHEEMKEHDYICIINLSFRIAFQDVMTTGEGFSHVENRVLTFSKDTHEEVDLIDYLLEPL